MIGNDVNINVLDVMTVLALLFCVLQGYRKGLLMSLFDFCGTIVAIVLAQMLYPAVSRLLMGYFSLHGMIKEQLSLSLGIGQVPSDAALKFQTELIQKLELPPFLIDTLISSNNREIYKLLRVATLEEYITGYIATVCVNIVAWIAVFILVALLIRVIALFLNVVTMLPVISGLNKIGGILVGFLQGTIFVWICFVVLTFFIAQPDFATMYEMLMQSVIASFFYEHNLLLDLIKSITFSL